MAFGVQVLDAAGTIVFDSNTAFAGVPADFFTVSQLAAGVNKTYPEFAGRTMRIVTLDISGSAGIYTIDYALGYPRLIVPAAGIVSPTVVVMA
jgi:hypothetical protein